MTWVKTDKRKNELLELVFYTFFNFLMLKLDTTSSSLDLFFCEGVFLVIFPLKTGGVITERFFIIYKPPLDTSNYFLPPSHFLYKYIQYRIPLCKGECYGFRNSTFWFH
jgi:hypothetical protein